MNTDDLRFARTHEWARTEEQADGSLIVTMGLTDFAMQLLTDLVFIDLPSVDAEVEAGAPCGEIESVKAVSEIFAPATGTVIEVNDSLADSLENMSSDPFGDGWIAKIKVSDKSSMDDLMDKAAYEKACQEE